MLVTVKESYVLFLFLEKFSTAHNKRKFVRPRPCVCVGEPSCGESKTASLVHSLGSRQSAHPPPHPVLHLSAYYRIFFITVLCRRFKLSWQLHFHLGIQWLVCQFGISLLIGAAKEESAMQSTHHVICHSESCFSNNPQPLCESWSSSLEKYSKFEIRF